MRPFLEERSARLYASVTRGLDFPEHLHPQAEMMYVFSGQTTMLVDGSSWSMRAGDLCLAFPGAIHGYLRQGPVNALMLIFSPEISADYGVALRKNRPECPLIRSSALSSDAHACLRAMAEEAAGAADERVLGAYSQVVLARAMPQLSLTEQSADRQGAGYRALKYLSEHFREPVTLPALARALGVSESHLSHIFSGRLRTNFRAYVNALRVDHARALLRNTDLPVTHIAYECGFETQRTFNRAFRELSGATPTAFRGRR